MNERYAEMKGVDREALLGTDIYGWVTDETAQKARAAREAMATGSQDVGVVEYDFVSADGETFPAEMRFTQVATGNNEFDRTGVIRDVSDRKQREESLRRKNEQLEQFASIVSHDLRNPLNVALGRVDLLRQTGDSDHIDAIEQALDRIQALIDDLLTLARHGEQVGEKSALSLPSVIGNAWDAVSTDDATLHIDTSQAIQADPSRLQQLFENLFRNSLEHGGSDVTITVGDLTTGFYVEDNGPGIPADQRTAVFEMGHTTTDAGTGFGLSIVKQIAVAHDWSIQATAGTDGGARFEITGVEAV